MINEVGFHVKRRYVERIIGITEQLERDRYLTTNDEKITNDILKMYEFSNFVYRGQIGEGKHTCNFHMRDNIILVCDSNYAKIITLYMVDYGFPEATNRKVANDLYDQVIDLRMKSEEQLAESKEYIEKKRFEAASIETQIKLMQEQIKTLEKNKQACQADIDSKLAENQFTNKELDRFANLLCNSLALKNDLKDLNK